MLKKILKIAIISLLILLVIGGLYIHFTLPSLPPNTDKVIQKALQSELLPLKGQTAYAQNGDVKIWYESILPKDSIKGHILLIMGISNDALAWPNYFIDPLVENGYQVIRFDNRGTGMTDWIEDWTQENAYSLEDIAADAMAVLDELQIEKAHILGVSLGGMIAQTIAIQHPNRTNTLISMMSSGDIMDKDLPSINTSLIKDLILGQIRYGLINTESNQIKQHVLARQLLQGSKEYQLHLEEIATSVLYNLRKRRGFNSNASQQQIAATMKTGSRYEALKKLQTPTLIIHGTKDPLINFEHGKKCYEMIPNAEKYWVEAMGHDIPEQVVEEVLAQIFQFIEKN